MSTRLEKVESLLHLEILRIKTENDLEKCTSVEERQLNKMLLDSTNKTIEDLIKELKV